MNCFFGQYIKIRIAIPFVQTTIEQSNCMIRFSFEQGTRIGQLPGVVSKYLTMILDTPGPAARGMNDVAAVGMNPHGIGQSNFHRKDHFRFKTA